MNTAQKPKELLGGWKTPKVISYLWEKLQKELQKPSKPSWVFVIITAVNVIAAFLLGLDRFFSIFDNRWNFFIGAQAAFFLIATLLVKKTKDNKTAMNTVTWIVAGVLLAGFTTNHSGIQSWMKDKDAEGKVGAINNSEAKTIQGKTVTLVAPVGKLSEWVEAPAGHRLFWESKDPLYVVILISPGKTVEFSQGKDETLDLRGIKAEKVAFRSLGGEEARVISYIVPENL